MKAKITLLQLVEMQLLRLRDRDFRACWREVKKSSVYRKHPRSWWRPLIFEQFDTVEYKRRFQVDPQDGSMRFYGLLMESSFELEKDGRFSSSNIDAVLNERHEVVHVVNCLGVSY